MPNLHRIALSSLLSLLPVITMPISSLATLFIAILAAQAATISRDARCGKDFRGTTCVGTVWGRMLLVTWMVVRKILLLLRVVLTVYSGSTPDHCLPSNGCQSASGKCTSTDTTLKVSQDGHCGDDTRQTCQNSDFGNCCSQVCKPSIQ
jgi:hypothetical protein